MAEVSNESSFSHSPWDIWDTDFPDDGTPEEKLRFLLQYAILAPSGHNRQPWSFRIHDDVLELLADRSRSMPAIDPDDRELFMSCGAALFHLRLALRHFGYTDEVTEFPDSANPDLVAQIRVGTPATASEEDELLFRAIPRRRTSRHPFLEHPVPAALLYRLGNSTRNRGVWLHFVEKDPERRVIADLVAEGERRQLQDPLCRRELLAWIHPHQQDERDGIPGYALYATPRVRPPGPRRIPYYETGREQVTRDRRLARVAPALIVVGTSTDLPQSWVRAGEALSKLLLRCTSERVYASFLNQPIQIADLRLRVRETVQEKGFPQLILRLGYGAEATPTPRRPVAEVLVPGT